jgi:hypothetical protein
VAEMLQIIGLIEGVCEVHDWTDADFRTRLLTTMRERHDKGGLSVCKACIARAHLEARRARALAKYVAILGEDLAAADWHPIGNAGAMIWVHPPSLRCVTVHEGRPNFTVSVSRHNEFGNLVDGEVLGPFRKDEAHRLARVHRQSVLDEQAKLDAAAAAAAGLVPEEQTALFEEPKR